MIIINVVYNRPNYIPYQYECLKKYIECDFEYYVFDNSSSTLDEEQFKKICNYLKVNYVRVPQDIHTHDQNPSNRAGKSLDYSLNYIYNNLNYRGIVMVNDSDLFLVNKYNPIKRLGDNVIVGRSPHNMYIVANDPYKDFIQTITYYTNQFLIINFDKIINLNEITFCMGSVNGTMVDCGGMLHEYFKKYPSITHSAVSDYSSGYFTNDNLDKCPEYLKEYFKNELDIFGNKTFSEIFDDVFLHLRAGSNWIGHDKNITFKREDNLFTFLCKKLISWNEIISPSDTNKYVISVSLYGNNPKYCYNAVINAYLANKIYSGWILRIYYDNSVPENIIQILKQFSNTELIYIDLKDDNPRGHERMLWRFYSASDENVNVMISRDCDSWLSFREAFSVKEWILSDKNFHIMRDHCYHSQKIMGGMWGIKRNTIPEMKSLCEDFVKTNSYDQGFLAEKIYPRILNCVRVHIAEEQYTNCGQKTNGYYNDGGISFVNYPLIREYIPSIDIEDINNINGFNCAHCGRVHQFFIGEMLSNLNENTKLFLNNQFSLN